MTSLRRPALALTTLLTLLFGALSLWHLGWLCALAAAAALAALAWRDALQKGDNVRRNYPIFGTLKSLAHEYRTIWQQAVIENPREGRPFDEIQRQIVYKRADDADMHQAFGTEYDYRSAGHEWLLHTNHPVEVDPASLRVLIGGPACTQPYEASLLNVSGMSYGSISPEATRALGLGAKIGGFALNTGEGGIAQCHLDPGCDLVFQLGTAYFGCRTKDGRFDAEKFKECAAHPQVRMVEVKISQGAKPGFGAILPASKNTPEIAKIRGIDPHTDVFSPPGHSAFHTPREMLAFLDRLRELAGGRPVGIKFCLGQIQDLFDLCQAMVDTGSAPDYLAVDGGEGGTGAGALDGLHWVGMPAAEAVAWAHDALVGFGLRHKVRLLASGRVASGFDVVRLLALGADGVYSARAMMMAVGCTQALQCDTNRCPTGVTTLDPRLRRGLVVEDKKQKVANYHRNTLKAAAQLLGAAGLHAPHALRRRHLCRRMPSGDICTFEQLYPAIEPGSLLRGDVPERLRPWLA